MTLRSIRLLCSLRLRSLDDFISDCKSDGNSFCYSTYIRYRQDAYWLYDLGFIDDEAYDDYLLKLDYLYSCSGRCDD